MKLIKSEKGQSMVETALVLPLVLLLLFGIFDFGWLFYNKLNIENCAREGARFAAVNYSVKDPTKSKDDVIKRVKDILPTKLTCSVGFKEEDDASHKNGYLTVTIKTEVPTLTPFIGAFFSKTDGKCPMEAAVTMYREKADDE